MKDVDSTFIDTLNAARDTGLSVARSIYLTLHDRETNDEAVIAFWTGDEDITTNIIDGTTGEELEATFIGGVNLFVDNIPRVSDLTVQSINVTLSQIAPSVQAAIRGYTTRFASCQIHEWLLGIDGIPVCPPPCSFLGMVDSEQIQTPSANSDGNISLSIVSEAILMLTRTNPRKRSYEGQKQRQGDEFGKYSNLAATAAYTIYWGEKSQ